MKFGNDTNRDKTERLMHRDKTERLLACLEGIDDDLVAEAARAVDNGKLRSPVWQRLSHGNIAAVFIGTIAMACVLMLGYWISTAEPRQTPAYNGGYGEDGGYPTPQPPVNGELAPGGILPIPRIPATGFEIILPPGQEHMTTNNPWHSIGHIDELPVFRNHAVAEFVMPPWSSMAWNPSLASRLSDEEWDEFVNMIYEMGRAIAIAAGVSPDRIVPEPMVDDLFVSIAIRDDYGSRVIVNKQVGTLSLTAHLGPIFEERIDLPQGASLAGNATAAEAQAAIESLAAQLADVMPMQSPTVTNAQGLLDVGGPMTYHRQRFFDAGGSAEDAILSFNFKWVEVLTFDPYHPEWIEIAMFPHEHFESLQLGHYPIITAEEAREMLLEGYFVSDIPDSMWPGQERALEASVELVYYSPIFSDVEVIMPFYRFLVEVEIPGTWEDIPEGYRAFIRYYVPAVHRDYLEPMTRRQVV